MLSRVRLCNAMDCSPPGSSVHGISQARVLEWVAIPRWLESSLTFAPGCGGPRRCSRESDGPQCVAVTLIIPESKELSDDSVGVSASSPVKPRAPCWKSSQTSKCTVAPSPSGAKKSFYGDFPRGSAVKTPCSQCRALGLIPGQGTRSHMPQLRQV